MTLSDIITTGRLPMPALLIGTDIIALGTVLGHLMFESSATAVGCLALLFWLGLIYIEYSYQRTDDLERLEVGQ